MTTWSFLRRLVPAAAARRPRRARLALETLEGRLAPATGSYTVPLPLGPSDGFSGVVLIRVTTAAGSHSGTGELIRTGVAGQDGYWVLTAGHVVAKQVGKFAPYVYGPATVTFQLPPVPGTRNPVTVSEVVPRSQIFVPRGNDLGRGLPGFVTQFGKHSVGAFNDIALMRLPQRAPAAAVRYPLYNGPAGGEFGTGPGRPTVTIAGYGQYGTGTTGGLSGAEFQRLTIAGTPAGGSFQLSFTAPDGTTATTRAIPYSAYPRQLAARIESALNGLSNLAPMPADQITVRVVAEPTRPAGLAPPPNTFDIVFNPLGRFGDVNVNQIQVAANDLTAAAGAAQPRLVVRTLVDGGDNVTYERITLTGATAGTFRLQAGSAFTPPIAFNATAGAMQAGLRQLTGVQEVNVFLVPGTPPGVRTFVAAFNRVDPAVFPDGVVPPLGADVSQLTGTVGVLVLSPSGWALKRMTNNQYAGDGRRDPTLVVPGLKQDFNSVLVYDFDSGLPAQDTLKDGTGLGAREGSAGAGDSGGPIFLINHGQMQLVATTTIGGVRFAAVHADERVAFYRGWIHAVVANHPAQAVTG